VHPTRVRHFPITHSGTSGDTVYPSLAYPYIKPIFSAAAAGILCAFLPVACILLYQIHPLHASAHYSRFDDASYAILGLAYSLISGTFFQVVLKKAIGGFRPHFLAVCQPVVPEGGGKGFQGLMYTSEVCTGNKARIQNAMESFPSGHSEIAFAGLLYLSLYLNAHLGVFSVSATRRVRRPKYLKMLAVLGPVLLATYLAATLVLGHHHHGHDVVFGALIGAGMAVWGYKMVFVSLWDGRTNWVPLRVREGDLEELVAEGLPMSRQEAGRGV
jgi:diacylglycerol diphosphate phosphatase / phosphatidate phosphatase